MSGKGFWAGPLYWALVALPMMLATGVFFTLPAWLMPVPGLVVSSGRAFVFLLPGLHVFICVLFYWRTGEMAKKFHKNQLEAGRHTDILAVLPGIRLFFVLLSSAMALASVYGIYRLDSIWFSLDFMGRAVAFVLGLGLAIWGLKLKDAGRDNFLALGFSYTQKSQNVWIKTHHLAQKVFYCTGGVLLLTAFLVPGVQGALATGVALCALGFCVYFYAKILYEQEFR